MSEAEEEKKADSGKVKLPSFLANEAAPKEKPAWMLKLKSASNHSQDALVSAENSTGDDEDTSHVDSPSRKTYKVKGVISNPLVSEEEEEAKPAEEAVDTKEKNNENKAAEKDDDEESPSELPTKKPPPPPPPVSSMDVSEHSVKNFVQSIDKNTPRNQQRKVADGSPAYLIAGSVPKAKQLDEENRKADELKRQARSNEAEPTSPASGSRFRSSLHKLKQLKEYSGESNAQSPGEVPAAQKTNIIDSENDEEIYEESVEGSESFVEEIEIESEEEIGDKSSWAPPPAPQDLGATSGKEEVTKKPVIHQKAAVTILPAPPSPPPSPPPLPEPPSPQEENRKEAMVLASLPNGQTEHEDESENEVDSWMFPHRNEDDSSWVNPSHPVEQNRKEHLSEELKKKSVDLFPEEGESTPRLAHLRAIDEEGKINDREISSVLVDRDGQTMISEFSEPEVSGKYDASYVMESAVPRKEYHDVWAMPSKEDTYRAQHKLEGDKDGKDYRFSYIATQHTHSTSSYADVVRERYFPKEDNDYWAAPAKDGSPELALHIARNGDIQSGPSDSKESWMPPEDDPEAPPVADTSIYYAPTLAEEKLSEAHSIVTEDSDWMARKNMANKSKRIDFSGAVIEDGSDDSFNWNPERENSPPPSAHTRNDDTGQSEESESEKETDSSDETDDEESESELAAIPPRRPRPPSPPPRKHSPDARPRSNRVAPTPNRDKDRDANIDYSPSGRLKFDMTPKMIVIENDVERGQTRSRDPGMPKDQQNRRLACLCCIFFFLLVSAAAICIVLFVIDPNDRFGNDSDAAAAASSPTPFPTLAPQVTSAPTAVQPVSPTPTEPAETEQTNTPTPPPSVLFPPSTSPGSSMPVMDEDVLVDFLTSISTDGGRALRDTNSPQYAAMQWVRTPANQGIFDDRVFIQRYALATLYYATDGAQWSFSTSWLTSASECEWYTAGTPSRLCDEDGNLVELNLRGNGLDGSIPPELNLLSNSLVSLELYDNRLSGTIPSSLADLSSLSMLNIANNQLQGRVPTGLGQLPNLTTLFLYSNSLTLTIPTQFGSLVSLMELDMGNNRLTGTLPSQLGGLTNLQSLALYNNRLEGTIPSQLSSATNLKLLYLDNNNFGPSLPPVICQSLSFDEFWTDCAELGGCSCCTKCCTDGITCV